ncbi:MAG TPA: hypothetical protein VG476_09125, partial [Acidimicrobiales bacterium]|nr:hypothetical protein [Acidimicrobiales bacterium]
MSGIYDDFESRCADALTELASTRLAEEADADRASVVIHTDASVLGGAEGSAEIENGPSISAETARRLACDCRWQLIAEDGATSMADWLVARLGVAHRTAREWVRVARSLEQLPALTAAYSEARLSFEQLAQATKLASPETDPSAAEQAPGCTAAQLEIAARRT